MLALANEVEQINYNVISEGISEFVKRLELFEWFEGLFINMSKATGFVVNLVYDGCKLDKQLFGFISALFAIISYESGISISLNKVDINSYADPDLHMYDIFGLKTGKIIKDNNGKINNLKSMLNNYDDCEEQEDMCSGFQYIK